MAASRACLAGGVHQHSSGDNELAAVEHGSNDVRERLVDQRFLVRLEKAEALDEHVGAVQLNLAVGEGQLQLRISARTRKSTQLSEFSSHC